MRCEQLREIAPELSLGAVDGEQRAGALAHLAECAACRGVVDELAGIADSLLLLAPEMEPPIGFESRVLDRLSSGRRAGGDDRRPRRMLGLVAAVALVLAGAAAGSAATVALRHHGSAVGPASAMRVAVANGRWDHPVCQVFAYQGHPSLVVVNVDAPGEVGTYSVELVTTTNTVPLGTIEVTDGRGSLGAVADADIAAATSVRVIEGDGHVLYEARFRTGARPD